jgi:glycine dehydrogenase
MTAIRQEIAAVESGQVQLADSPLRHAPHTARSLAGEWSRSYSREEGAFPAGFGHRKYWPPVGRIDQAYGDRNLVCSCPDPSAFED